MRSRIGGPYLPVCEPPFRLGRALHPEVCTVSLGLVSLPPDVEHGDPGRVNSWLRHVLDRVTVDMSVAAKRSPQ